jgi:UDP-N-acetylglucosamine 2-epimerase
VIDAQLSVVDEPLLDETRLLLDKLNVGRSGPAASGDSSPGDAQGSQRLLLVTAHRRENFGGPLENICDAVARIASRYSDLRIAFLVHLNPNVRKIVHSRLRAVENVSLLPPVDYQAMTHLMKQSRLILTDSGGLQEEAPTFHVPVLVMRETTERPEAIEAGTARLVGTRTDDIVDNVFRLLDDPAEYRAMSGPPNPFGDGHASERIVSALVERARRNADPDV